MAEDFDWAICQSRVDMRWSRYRHDGPIAPVCRRCETYYGRHRSVPMAGAFRDRREVRRGLALSEALRCEAAQQKWRQADARA